MPRTTNIAAVAPIAPRALLGLGLGLALGLSGCAASRPEPAPTPTPAAAPESAVVREPQPQPDWISTTLSALTLEQKAAQLVMPWVDGSYMARGDEEYEKLRRWVVEDGIGGLVMSIGMPYEVAAKLNALQRLAEVPLLVTTDMEHGPGQRLNGGRIYPYGIALGGGTAFPPVMAIGATGDPALAYALGRATAEEARAVGVHMDFAPVADVNNNPANPIINTRSYGEDPAQVAGMVAAHVRGLQEHGMLSTAKHFPGHGDTGVDSHIELPVITVDRARADAVELVPFRAAIEADVAAVMTAHIAFPALTGGVAPATLSPAIIQGLLRDDLGFDGIVVSDALDMGAIVNEYGAAEAAVLTLEAGADILLMPTSVPDAIAAVAAAVRAGRIPEARLDASVRRLLEAKATVGLDRDRTVDLARLPEHVGTPAHHALAREIAERSITAARDRDRLLPIAPGTRVLSIVYTDDADPLAGRALQAELRARFPDARTALLWGETGSARLDSLAAAAADADVVLFSAFVRVLARKGDVAVAEPVAALVRRLAAERPLIVTSFGNPYILAQFPEVGTYVLAWGQEEVAQVAAARALAGLAPITGRLPISIPPYHAVGDGVQITATTSEGGP
ncbi:MAG: glycoside hydrolase family 3 protein [Longimicrobiales bacterium]